MSHFGGFESDGMKFELKPKGVHGVRILSWLPFGSGVDIELRVVETPAFRPLGEGESIHLRLSRQEKLETIQQIQLALNDELSITVKLTRLS